jgi:hypothetical protein
MVSWSIIPPISTKQTITSHLNSLNTKKESLDSKVNSINKTIASHLNSLNTKKESLNSQGQQYQQNKQSPLTLTHWTQRKKV